MYVLLGYLCSEIGPGISNIAVSVSRLSVPWWFSIDWYSEMRLLMESIPEPMSTWESSFTQAAEALTGLVKASYHQNHLEILIQRNQIKEIVFSLFPANDRSKASTVLVGNELKLGRWIWCHHIYLLEFCKNLDGDATQRLCPSLL